MAAFGILAALRERDRSGEGQFVDVSMADGALSWLAMVAARVLRRRRRAAARRARARRAGCSATGPTAAPTAGSRSARSSRSSAQPGAAGVGREDLVERQFERARLATRTREVEAIFAARTRAEWEAFDAEHDCCLEPVLELDEALDSELVRAREMVVELEQPGAARAGAAARRAGQALAHAGRPDARGRARRWASTPTRCWPRPATRRDEIAALLGAGAVARRRRTAVRGTFLA